MNMKENICDWTLKIKSRDFICPCGKSYLSYPALFTHIKQKHNGKVRKKLLRHLVIFKDHKNKVEVTKTFQGIRHGRKLKSHKKIATKAIKRSNLRSLSRELINNSSIICLLY